MLLSVQLACFVTVHCGRQEIDPPPPCLTNGVSKPSPTCLFLDPRGCGPMLQALSPTEPTVHQTARLLSLAGNCTSVYDQFRSYVYRAVQSFCILSHVTVYRDISQFFCLVIGVR